MTYHFRISWRNHLGIRIWACSWWKTFLRDGLHTVHSSLKKFTVQRTISVFHFAIFFSIIVFHDNTEAAQLSLIESACRRFGHNYSGQGSIRCGNYNCRFRSTTWFHKEAKMKQAELSIDIKNPSLFIANKVVFDFKLNFGFLVFYFSCNNFMNS